MKTNELITTATARAFWSTAALASLLTCLAATGTPQTVEETLDLTREAVEKQRRVLVSGALPLSDAEADAFWPLYDEYEKKRQPIDARANRLVADFLARQATLTDDQAKAMLAEALDVDDERLALRRRYVERMAKVIPPRKVVRFYQIDNKLDSVVRADLSRQIPLVP